MTEQLILDRYGIGAAQFMALDMFENASRRSGRTTTLARSVYPGDAILVPNSEVARCYRHAVEDALQKTVMGWKDHTEETVAIIVHVPNLRGIKRNPHGETHLSHDFVWERYREMLRDTARRLERLSNDMSQRDLTEARHPKHLPGQVMNEIAYGRHPL